MEADRVEFKLADQTYTIETGRVARQAGGSAMIFVDGLALLCCATGTKEPREGVDFFPLMVDYEERFYAAGKFPGGFIKREGRPSEVAVLTARKVDRPIRPMFPDDFHNEVQIIISAFSQDNINIPDTHAITGASLALALSNIPWPKPIAAVRMAFIDGEYIVNPSFQQVEESQMNLLVAGTRDRINMIENESQEVPVSVLMEGFRLAHEHIKTLIDQIEQFASTRAKPKMEYTPVATLPEEMAAKVTALAQPKIEASLPVKGKEDLFAVLDSIKKEVSTAIVAEEPEVEVKLINSLIGKLVKKHARKLTMQGTRVDGRGFEEIRDIWGTVDLLPRVHGSAVFTRGQTQVLTSVTLGSGDDRQRIDTVNYDATKRYMHHYNFPPYSVGEVRFMRGAGRREIGHGILAEKALVPVLPDEDTFPYTMRVVSEVTESNASSSMASTCGSTLALMAAGVPLKRPVAGIGVGLVTDGDDYRLLLDLMGFEDFNGDMDFKVTGSEDGVTAIQLDVKIEGLTMEMVEKTMELAERGYKFVLGKMQEIIPEARAEISELAPRLEMLQIDVDQIGMVIGPSGKNIKKICADTETEIDIDDEGKVYVAGTNHEGVKRAIDIIRAMTRDIEVGDEFNGPVVRIMPFAAFIELVPGRDGFLHISNMAERRIEKVEDVLNMGDKVPVKVADIDDQGKISLIRTDIEQRPPRDGGDRRPDDRRGGGGDRSRGGRGGGGDRGGRSGNWRNDRDRGSR